MKILAFLFSTIGLLAADDIKVSTVLKTNAVVGAVTTKEYFSRAGQTNLLRNTTRNLTNGVVTTCSHIIFNGGKRIAMHSINPSRGNSITYSEGTFEVSFKTTTNLLTQILVADKDGNAIDLFVGTTGMLAPVPSSELREWNGKAKDAEEAGDAK